MFERINIAYRLLKCVSLNNTRDLKGFERNLDKLEDAVAEHLDRRFPDW